MRGYIDSKRSVILVLILSIILLVISTLFSQAHAGNNKLSQFFEFLLLSRVWIGAIFCLIGLVLLYKNKLKHNIKDFYFQMATLEYSIDHLHFLRDWYQKFLDGLDEENSNFTIRVSNMGFRIFYS